VLGRGGGGETREKKVVVFDEERSRSPVNESPNKNFTRCGKQIFSASHFGNLHAETHSRPAGDRLWFPSFVVFPSFFLYLPLGISSSVSVVDSPSPKSRRKSMVSPP